MQTPAPYAAGPPDPIARTHGLAIGSVISAALACCCPVVPAILAIVLGVIASSEIKSRPDLYTGDGLAKTGVALGVVMLVLQVLGLVLLFALGTNADRISALADTPPAEVFEAGNIPRDGVAFLQANDYLASDERIVLYYDDSVWEKFAALSVLTDRRVLTIFDGEVASVVLADVRRVRYVPGTLFRDYVIHVHDEDGRHLNLIFYTGGRCGGFREPHCRDGRRGRRPATARGVTRA